MIKTFYHYGTDRFTTSLNQKINEYGEDGWVLISCQYCGYEHGSYIYFVVMRIDA